MRGAEVVALVERVAAVVRQVHEVAKALDRDHTAEQRRHVRRAVREVGFPGQVPAFELALESREELIRLHVVVRRALARVIREARHRPRHVGIGAAVEQLRHRLRRRPDLRVRAAPGRPAVQAVSAAGYAGNVARPAPSEGA